MYKEDLALSNLQWLICHKTQPNPTKSMYICHIQLRDRRGLLRYHPRTFRLKYFPFNNKSQFLFFPAEWMTEITKAAWLEGAGIRMTSLLHQIQRHQLLLQMSSSPTTLCFRLCIFLISVLCRCMCCLHTSSCLCFGFNWVLYNCTYW